jgi:hypothetical protein
MNQEKSIHIGVFRDVDTAEAAVDALVRAGYPRQSITVIAPKQSEAHFEGTHREKSAGARTPSAIAVGGTIGVLLGGLTAAAVAASGGTLLLIAGPLLGGTAAAGLVGSFIGAMMTRGFEHEVADYYDQALRRGAILVAVESSEGSAGAERAKQVFELAGAEPVDLTKS